MVKYVSINAYVHVCMYVCMSKIRNYVLYTYIYISLYVYICMYAYKYKYVSIQLIGIDMFILESRRFSVH